MGAVIYVTISFINYTYCKSLLCTKNHIKKLKYISKENLSI